MIVTCGRDSTLPNESEGQRLAARLQRCHVHHLPLSCHAPLSEPGVDLRAMMQEDGFFVTERVFTSAPPPGASAATFSTPPMHAGPAEVPTARENQRYRSQYTQHFFDLCSPVMLSTAADGTVVHGLAGLPTDVRPLLLVGNHQLCGQDVMPLVDQIWNESGVLVRGIIHPNLFGHMKSQEELEKTGSQDFGYQEAMANCYATYGGVPVSPRNLFRCGQAAPATAVQQPGHPDALLTSFT